MFKTQNLLHFWHIFTTLPPTNLPHPLWILQSEFVTTKTTSRILDFLNQHCNKFYKGMVKSFASYNTFCCNRQTRIKLVLFSHFVSACILFDLEYSAHRKKDVQVKMLGTVCCSLRCLCWLVYYVSTIRCWIKQLENYEDLRLHKVCARSVQ